MILIETWPFLSGKILGFVLLVLIFVLTTYYIRRAKLPYLRRVLALDVIEDAVGRSTEMGRPILESYGTTEFNSFVVASLSILSYVARLTAKVDNRVIVPTGGNPGSMITRPVAVDIVKSAYEAEGKGELFNENDLPFLSYEFFSFAAGYVGLILRERPGAVIVGPETADALMYVEEANAVGALTIATGSYISNVAVLACAANYIMIGEEALAAGAYLSKEQSRITSLRTVDIFKFLAIVIVVVGVILLQLKSNFIIDLLST